MQILSAGQIRSWDQYTIGNEPIASIDLMERAALTCVEWLAQQQLIKYHFAVFCGKGNNGGDGLAIARLLAEKGSNVTVSILEFGHKGTDDFQANLERLHQYPQVTIRFIQTTDHFHPVEKNTLIIDALFGSGLNRKLEGVTAALTQHINQSGQPVIAIDIPSGMFADQSSAGNPVVHADNTLSFQCYKQAFLMTENAAAIGQLHILDIGLHPGFVPAGNPFELVDETMIRGLFKPRQAFAHKGSYGHALLVAGSHGKIGAAVLAAKSCLHSGVGLLTCHIPGCGYPILQTAVPEAMVLTDFNSSFNTKIDTDLSVYKAVGMGPGLGQASETKQLVHDLLIAVKRPLVIDADALNMLAASPQWLSLVPAESILTPHPKEFARLFGDTDNEYERINRAVEKAKELNCVIIVKGHHSFIATPGGRGYFNNTGNAGMATGGTGDVLTGLLTGLLCQGYAATEAAILGVYLHGLAGDLAAEVLSQEALTAGDLTSYIGKAFLLINKL